LRGEVLVFCFYELAGETMNMSFILSGFYKATGCPTYALCLVVGAFVTAVCSPAMLMAAEAPVFEMVRDSLAIITAGKSTGSGFVCQLNGKKYLITNEHVLRGGQPFSARLLNGKEISFLSLEVADDRDLVRMEITGSAIEGLVVSTKKHNLHDPVFVFGNSDGEGVATSLSGKLLGIGPVSIETDATFVRGNSGSPIIDSEGKVMAVATYAIRDPNPNDWVKQGSRFTDVRRFGVKMDGVVWKLIDQKDYFIRAHALADIETFCLDLYKLRFTSFYLDPAKRRYNYRYASEKKRYVSFPRLCKILSDAVVSFNEAVAAIEDAERRIQYAKQNPGAIDAETTSGIGIMKANQAAEKHKKAYKKVYADVFYMLKNNNWLTTCMEKDAALWLEVVKIITENEGD